MAKGLMNEGVLRLRDVATIGGMSTFSSHTDTAITDIHHGDPRVLLRHLYDVAVQRAMPLHNTAAHLPW
jgi:hypothetical protein